MNRQSKKPSGKARRQPRKAPSPARKTNPRKVHRKAKRKPSPVFAFFKKLTYWGTVAGLWVVLGFAGLMAYYALSLPSPDQLKVPRRAPSILILDRNGGELARRGAYRGNALRIEDIPPHLLQAVIATEDRRFYSHFGVDPLGLARAAFTNLFAGRIVQGGSTISQQLAKNLFLKPDRTFGRKMREFQLALWLERKYSKNQILEMYLNRVYLGAGTYGVDAAAQRYFGKSARHVTLSEAATLAGLLKAPSRYAPNKNPKLARIRTALVLKNMRSEGYISDAELNHALKYPGTRAIRKPVPGSGYAVDCVASMLREYAGELEGDVVVETTLDRGLQKTARQIVQNMIRHEGVALRASQAALVAMDEDGAIRALVGGVDYGRSQFNRAVKAHRQPGSAFKPFVYLCAIEAGLTPRTIRTDRPMIIKGWMPRNYSGNYSGKMSLQNALARSVNTVAAGLAREVGIKKVISTARRLGISSSLHKNPSLSLGTAEVTLLELTGAYTPFMNGGFSVIPHVITRIRSVRGKVLFERSGSGPRRVIKPEHVAAMNAMLRAVVTYGTGKHARMNRTVAGKTGTSQGFRDAWFIGYSGDLSTGVWVGNDDGSSMNKVTGGGLPARIWKAFMQDAHEGLPDRGLPGIGRSYNSGLKVASSSKTDLFPLPQRVGKKPRFSLDAGFLKRLFSGSNSRQ